MIKRDQKRKLKLGIEAIRILENGDLSAAVGGDDTATRGAVQCSGECHKTIKI